MIASACTGPSATADPEPAAAPAETTPRPLADPQPQDDTFDCPVTTPVVDGFTPPAPYPQRAPFADEAWYGTDGLWTALRMDGTAPLTKMLLWWSAEYPGGADEPSPQVDVVWTYLGPDPAVGRMAVHPVAATTNGYTPESGWLMMASSYPRDGVDEDSEIVPGCWRVDGSYQTTTLHYVVDVPVSTD